MRIEAGEETNKKMYVANLPPHVSLLNPIHPCSRFVRLTQVHTSVRTHIQCSIFVFIVKVTLSCRLPFLFFFVSAPMPVRCPIHSRDPCDEIKRHFRLNIEMKIEANRRQTSPAYAYFYCWRERTHTHSQKENYYRHVNLRECVSMLPQQIHNQMWVLLIRIAAQKKSVDERRRQQSAHKLGKM